MKIEIKNVSKKIKHNLIIDNISLTMETGHIYGLHGRNGSGKSVFLKLLCGFYSVTNGDILIDGINYNKEKEIPKFIKALIEEPSFFPELSGYKNLKLLADIRHEIGDKEILEALNIVNLTNEKDKKYGYYSLGMKQKLGIAQAIMEDSKILILDEPFNGIEEATVKKLIKYLKQIKKDKIIIVSTHIKEDLETLSDKIYYFDNGKLIKGD